LRGQQDPEDGGRIPAPAPESAGVFGGAHRIGQGLRQESGIVPGPCPGRGGRSGAAPGCGTGAAEGGGRGPGEPGGEQCRSVGTPAQQSGGVGEGDGVAERVMASASLTLFGKGVRVWQTRNKPSNKLT